MKNKSFKSIERILLPDMIVEQIKEMIANGDLKVGDKIPSEMKLAEHFGVGRTTIREAIKSLCLIEVLHRTNAGTFVSDNIHVFHSEKLTYKLLMQGNTLTDVYEARLVLEGENAALAALRAKEEDIEKLKVYIEKTKMAIENEDIEAYFEADMNFHFEIARLANNSILLELFTVVYEVMMKYYEKVYSLVTDKEYLSWGIKNHEDTLNAIKNRDPEEARKSARKPMLEAEKKLKEALKYSEKTEEM